MEVGAEVCVRTKGASLVVRSIEVPWVERVRCGTISWPHAVSACPMASTFKRVTLRRIGSRRVKHAFGASPSRVPYHSPSVLQPLLAVASYSRAVPIPAPVRSGCGESPAKPSGATAQRRDALLQLAKEGSTSALAAAVAATGNAGGVRTHPPRCGQGACAHAQA